LKQKAKRLSAFILTVAMILSLTACSENTTSVTSGTSINESGNESVDNSEITSETSSDVNENITVQNSPNKVDDTLPQCEPANMRIVLGNRTQSIMKGNEGYYYSTVYESMNGWRTLNALHYYDNKTEKSLILCSKPQCTHDGNEFCTATATDKMSVSFDSAYYCYGNFIYKVFSTRPTADNSTQEFKLYRYDLMGNERSEIATLATPVVTTEDMPHTYITQSVFHYGKMFYVIHGDVGMKADIYMLDLESGESKRIMTPTTEDGAKRISDAFGFITADGDWLYYPIRYGKYNSNGQQTDANMSYDKTFLYRFNIKTGETETVSAMPDIYSSYTVNDGIVYYTVVDRKNNTFSLYSYDITADKTATLAENIQQNYLDGKYIVSNNPVTVYTDRQYLYISTCGDTQHYREDLTDRERDFYIYSFDGKQLLHGLKGLPTDREEWSFVFHALNGEIYLNFNACPKEGEEDVLSGVYMIKTEDLINGGTEWKKLYKAIN